MERRDFVKSCGCSAAAALLLMLTDISEAQTKSPEKKEKEKTEKEKPAEEKKTPLLPYNKELVSKVFSYIDSDIDKESCKQIFEYMGRTEANIQPLKGWINSFKNNTKLFFDRVNIENKSTYWEKLIYDTEESKITLIGRPVDRCACPQAQCEKPSISLCLHCCKKFQEQLFENLLGVPVTVTIDQSYLLGQNRCSATIRAKGKLPPLTTA